MGYIQNSKIYNSSFKKFQIQSKTTDHIWSENTTDSIAMQIKLCHANHAKQNEQMLYNLSQHFQTHSPVSTNTSHAQNLNSSPFFGLCEFENHSILCIFLLWESSITSIYLENESM